jgi:hypothetical protein
MPGKPEGGKSIASSSHTTVNWSRSLIRHESFVMIEIFAGCARVARAGAETQYKLALCGRTDAVIVRLMTGLAHAPGCPRAGNRVVAAATSTPKP